ncbi:H-NS family nucleoid-associated regulatory protein [Pararhodobacter sp. CCB-MM2]|uniref:H-NS histone family protein n=1 Tax=Pararhodobacter sp. CCB-MM2 TaxID=1786003 RepID=UPI00082A7C84|nr:H-NS histone family protein [Pararhodobacter sp. CCB-MM2]
MSKKDLETLSLDELKKLQKDVAKAIGSYEDRQKLEARAKVEAMAKEMGFSLTQLVGPDGKKNRPAVPPKYEHPENPEITWSGRGRRPQWFIDAIASGKTEDDLAVKGA